MDKLFTLKKAGIHEKVHAYSLIALGISIPFSFLASNYLTVLLVVNWILSGNYNYKLKELWSNKYALATLLLFFLFASGLIHTSNLDNGFKDLEHKLSLLLLPFVILSMPVYTSSLRKQILVGFAISTLLVSSIALLLGLYQFIESGDISQIFYHQLSYQVGLHAVYLSCYLVFTFIIVLTYYKVRTKGAWHFIGWLVLLTYIVTLLILLSSKIFLLIFLVVISLYFLFHLLKKYNKIKVYTFLAILNLSVIIATITIPYTSGRFKDAINTDLSVLSEEKFKYDTQFSGLSIRLLFWKYAYQINKQNNAMLFGVGTGDSQSELNKKFKEHNLYLGNPNIAGDTGYLNYNTHSLYFETFLKLGIVGLLLLIAYFVSIMVYSLKKRDMLFTLWLLIFILFSLTESTLQVNKGIVYFAFFISIFLHQYSKEANCNS